MASTNVVAAALFVLQRYYLRTSQQMRLIDIEAKTPPYNRFVEIVHGQLTIRAFPAFRKVSDILDKSQRRFYILFCIQQWLQLILDLIVGAIVIVAVATSMANGLTAGALGVALMIILQFIAYLTQIIQSSTRLATSIGALARSSFVQETILETPRITSLHSDWPFGRAICVHSGVAYYAQGQVFA
jgi:ATP-binding cassette, subfamily C (CFTR/MRP), member 1